MKHLNRFAKDKKVITTKQSKPSAITDLFGTLSTIQKYTGFNDDMNGHITKIPFSTWINAPYIEPPSTVSVTTFKRMTQVNPIIGASLEFTANCIIHTIGDFTHPNKKVQDGIRKMHQLKNPESIWREMLSALPCGHSTGEKEYDYHHYFGYKYIKNVRFSPPELIRFMADEWGDLLRDTGILQLQFNVNTSLINNGMFYGAMGGYEGIDSAHGLGSYSYPNRVPYINPIGVSAIPTANCLHWAFSFGGSINNPYGESILEKVYGDFMALCAIEKLEAQHLLRAVAPAVVAFVKDSNASTQDEHAQYIQHVAQALANIGDLSAVAIPGFDQGETANISLKTLDIAGNHSQAFKDAIDRRYRNIQRGLLIPESMFNIGETGGSYAIGTSQGSVHDKLISGVRRSMLQAYVHQVIRDEIEMNFTPDEHQYNWGEFGNRALTIEEEMQIVKVWEAKIKTGLADINSLEDRNEVRAQLSGSEILKIFEPYVENKGTNMRDAKQVYTNNNDVKG